MKRRVLLIAAVASVVGVAALLGGALSETPSVEASTPGQPEAAAERLLAGFSPGGTAAYVRSLEAKVSRDPADGETLVLLGLTYLQRARETADPSFYPRAERAFLRGLTSGGDRYHATIGLASLAASRHRFGEAGRLAAQARDLRPWSAAAYGILADSLIERGRYAEGFKAVDRMVALRPGLSSYTRLSYARELLGRRPAALKAMRFALDVGSGDAESVAWTLVQLGHLAFEGGNLRQARLAYRSALAVLPGYVHARAGAARVAAAQGRFGSAVRTYRHVVAATPLPQYVVAFGDTLAAAGRKAEARRTYGLVAALERLLAANGVRTELETALFDLDHERDVSGALARARAAYAAAPSIHAEDVLAWALYRIDRCREARTYSARAVRLGTRDALKYFHRGMIERCLGNDEAARAFLARALRTNPHFSLLWAPVAEAVLAR